MRKFLVAGNWKMNGDKESARELVSGLLSEITPEIQAQADVLICPSYPHLAIAQQLMEKDANKLLLGAQDLSLHESGAFTGQVSAAMLKDLGCRYTLVGHSERRQYCNEDDLFVAAKAEVALAAGLKPIVCLGETQAQRDANQTQAVIEQQLSAVLERCAADDLMNATIAYEPVWAIGTGLTATPEQAQDVHGFIRELVAKKSTELAQSMQILYGGSVKANNAADLFAKPDIDGALVGGASLNLTEFVQICATTVRISR